MLDQRAPHRPWTVTVIAIAAVAGTTLGASSAYAAAGCTLGALQALNIHGLDVTAATDVPASATAPGYCDVTGTLNTTGSGAGPGSAAFEYRLPVNWNQKFLFFGVGGLAGSTYADFSANPVDLAEALTKGYATAITDEGHQAGNTDAAWALLSPAKPDQPKVTDYYYRATHEVTLAGKQLVRAYYGATIKQSYFDGCSNGGRQAMIEATDFPADYDGIISGAPFFDIRTIIQSTKLYRGLLQSSQTYIPATLLPQIDKAVYAACDATDGVADGLIQNPAACSVDPHRLVCTATQTASCVPGLTEGMADTLTSYLSKTTDQQGNFVYNGYSITDLNTGGGFDIWGTGFVNPPPKGFNVAEPWGNSGFSPAPISWQFADHIQKYLVTRDPTFDLLAFPVNPATGTVQNEALALFDSRTEAGSARDPIAYVPFLASGRKLLIYHGFSDPALPPFRTTRLYQQLARIAGSYSRLQSAARLFMVPDMQHCGGGPGPNNFDTLSALEAWVEQNVPPEGIVASHYAGNNPGANPVPDRTMPLCKFPEQARYVSGPVNVASSWSCNPADQSLLRSGLDGAIAGANELSHPLTAEEERGRHEMQDDHD